MGPQKLVLALFKLPLTRSIVQMQMKVFQATEAMQYKKYKFLISVMICLIICFSVMICLPTQTKEMQDCTRTRTVLEIQDCTRVVRDKRRNVV